MGLLKYHNGTTWVAIEDGVSDYSAFIQNDNLAGTVDGTNRVFTTTRNFASISLYVNGVKQNPGAGNDYIVTGANQVTFETGAIPQVNAVITADFTTSSSYTVTGTNSFVRKQVVTGAINGTNKVYTTASPYMPGTLEVFVNGLRQGLPHVVETTPTTGTFTLDEAPLTGDNVEVAYMIASVPSGNADSVDTFHASATPTPNTLMPLGADSRFPLSTVKPNLSTFWGYRASTQTTTLQHPGAIINLDVRNGDTQITTRGGDLLIWGTAPLGVTTTTTQVIARIGSYSAAFGMTNTTGMTMVSGATRLTGVPAGTYSIDIAFTSQINTATASVFSFNTIAMNVMEV